MEHSRERHDEDLEMDSEFDNESVIETDDRSMDFLANKRKLPRDLFQNKSVDPQWIAQKRISVLGIKTKLFILTKHDDKCEPT